MQATRFGKTILLESVWPGVLVVDASLATAVSKLRRYWATYEIIKTVIQSRIPDIGSRAARH